MTVTATMFGHPIQWHEGEQVWLWEDTGLRVPGWGGEPRPCRQCGDLPTPEGDDPCIGHIPGVYSACCGHGVEDGYILWEHLRPSTSDMRRLRESLGLSLSDVATGTGLTKGYLSTMERNVNARPSLDVARRLARFYGTTLDELFPETEATS